MGPIDFVVIGIVLVAGFFGARRAIGTATGKRDCCSGDAKSTAKIFKPTKIEDTNEAHYPYATDLTIAGMTCENCVRHVTDALNSIEGTWARVDLESRRAHILRKSPISEEDYRRVVGEAGYRVI